MEKRTLIALALSFAVLGFYPLLLQKMYPDYYKQQKAVKEAAKTEISTEKSGTAAKQITAPSSSPVPASGQDISFESDKLQLLFNDRNASIREINFKRFLRKSSEPLQLFSLEDLGNAPTAIRFKGLSEEPGPFAVTQLSGVINASGSFSEIKVAKSYSFKENSYGADLTLLFENTSAKPLEFQYQLFAGSSIPQRNAIDGQYIEANFYSEVNGKKELKHPKESKAGKSVQSSGRLEWVANKDRHFAIVLKPQAGEFSGNVQGLGDHRFEVSLLSDTITLAPQASVEHKFLLYIGPNDINELLPLGLDPLVNFGKLDMIGKLLIGGLDLLYKIFKNYGIAIIVLTFLINVVLFPLTRASYMSMKRMQLIQPQMTKLREQNKKNPEKLNREMMELYKKHKVNPFGGCLPMLLQMPVFMALYVALCKAVHLMNSHFLWIHDLSSPDEVPLPFSLPFIGNTIHALPLIMVAAMAIQQKFTQIKMEGQDPAMESQQKMMATIMPIMFGFIFYTMPSGLVLYWLTNTILMALYQLRLKRMTLT